MNARSPNNGFRPARRDQLRQERVHDSYKLRGKLPEPTVCSQCGAVYHAERWQWGKRPTGAQEVACAAGKFGIWPVTDVDQAIELLTGIPCGEPNELGEVPEGSINFRVATQLAELSALRQAFSFTATGATVGRRRGSTRHEPSRATVQQIIDLAIGEEFVRIDA